MAIPVASIGPAQLQAIGQQLETHIDAAKDLLIDLEQRFAHLSPEGDAGGLTREHDFTQVSETTSHVHEGLQKLTQSVSETAAQSQQTLTQLSTGYTQFNQQVDLGEQELQDCHQTVQTHGEETTALLEQFLQSLQRLFEQTGQTYQTTEQEIAQLHQTGLQTFNTVESTLHNFQQNAVQHSQTELENAAQHLQEQLRNLGNQQIQNFAHTIQNRFDETQTHFTQTSSELSHKVQTTVEQLLTEAGQFAQEQGQHQISEQVEKLIQGAVQRLVEEIVLAIIETEAGASITGALMPIMPKLIVVYKAIESIKEAIRIWKELQDTLGGAGHIFSGA